MEPKKDEIIFIDRENLAAEMGKISDNVVQVEANQSGGVYYIYVNPLTKTKRFELDKVFMEATDKLCFNAFKAFVIRHSGLQYRVLNLSNSNKERQFKIYNWLIDRGYDAILTNERFMDRWGGII